MSTRARLWTALLAVYVIWGSTYLAIRFAVETIPPFLMAGIRFLVAGSALFLWQKTRGAPWPTRLEWREATIIGGLMLLGGNGGVSWAEQTVPSGIAALIVSTVPIWIVLLDWLWLRNARPTPRILLGLTLGFLGVAILVRPEGATAVAHGGASLLGVAVVVAASGLWGAGSLYSKRAKLPASPLLAIGMEMVAGGVLLLILGTVLGEWAKLDPARVSARSLLSLAYLICFGSLIGFTAYLWLLRATTPARAASYAFVNPVVAILLGALLAGETLSPRTFVAAAVALTGVALIVRSRPVSV